MVDRLIIAPQWVREAWEDIQTWSDARTQREAQRLQRQQPFVLVYLLATLEDEGAEALTLGFELAHAVGGAYRRALGVQPTPIGEHVMEQAAEETMSHFADLAEAEPELAYRRMMFGRELAVPAVLTECLKILFEVSADVPEIEAALGALFISIMAIAKAYERVHGMAAADSAKSSLAESIEQETGQPIPKLGRNEPCPCGSGKKFKKCCGQRTAPPPAPRRLSHAEEELQRSLDIVDRVWTYVEESKRDPDVRWLTTALDRFAARYHPGEPNGVPDSLYLSGGLFDFVIPRRERTLGELFLERRGARLTEAGRRSLRELCASYVAFYEVLEPRPAEHTKRLRELVSGDEWLANDVEESDVELSEPGMIWLCRLVGPREDAVTFMSPLVYPVAAHAGIEGFVRALLAGQPAMGLPAVMKRSVEALADYIIATMPVEADDEADADDDILCDEDWDDDE